VLSDLSALRYDYKYEYKKLKNSSTKLSDDFLLRVYVSFEGLFHVPHERFEQIEEWSSNEERCFVIGTIRFSRLAGSDWWKKKNTSLILWPDAFVETTNVTKRHLTGVAVS